MTVAPALSVVLPLLARSGTWEHARRAFHAQTVADRLELVTVTSLPDVTVAEQPARGLRERVVVVPAGTPRAEALTIGIGVASAEIVAFAEDHAFPEPAWAEALLAAHGRGDVAVGPAIANANPASALSWGNLLLGYAPWVPPVAAGPADELPAEHASYRREILLEQGSSLSSLLVREGELQQQVRSRGHELVLEPRAVVRHLNASKLRDTADLRFNAGRLFAANRARTASWSRSRRLLYACGSPVIPAVRFVRIMRELRGRRHDVAPRVVAGIAVAVALDGAGQLLGYVAGPGGSAERIARLDLDRARSCSRRDLRALAV